MEFLERYRNNVSKIIWRTQNNNYNMTAWLTIWTELIFKYSLHAMYTCCVYLCVFGGYLVFLFLFPLSSICSTCNENSYRCNFKPVWLSFFCGTWKKIFFQNHVVTKILQNIFLCVPKKKENIYVGNQTASETICYLSGIWTVCVCFYTHIWFSCSCSHWVPFVPPVFD